MHQGAQCLEIFRGNIFHKASSEVFNPIRCGFKRYEKRCRFAMSELLRVVLRPCARYGLNAETRRLSIAYLPPYRIHSDCSIAVIDYVDLYMVFSRLSVAHKDLTQARRCRDTDSL